MKDAFIYKSLLSGLSFHILTAFTFITSTSVIAAEAQSDLFDLSIEQLMTLQVTVDSTRPQSLFDSNASVSVITEQDIKIYGYQSVLQAISQLAGVEKINTYFQKSLTTIRGVLQDNYANKVLIMINNVPSWDGTYSDSKVNSINIRDVERIEVLKGPSSVLYGTNAYSGAINIKLKNHASAYKKLNVQIGEKNSYSLNYAQNYKWSEDTKLFLSLTSEQEAEQSVSFTDETGETRDISEYIENDSITLALNSGAHKLLFNAYEINENFFAVIPVYSRAGGSRSNKGQMLGYGYQHSFFSDDLFKYQFVYDHTKKHYFRYADLHEYSFRESERYSHSLSYTLALDKPYALEFGLDHETRKNLDFSNYNNENNFVAEHNVTGRSVYSYALWSQFNMAFDKHHWLLGLRNTENELFGNNLSGRLSYQYRMSDLQRVKLIAAQSYRAPSLFELYFENSITGLYGNPDLLPETSDSFELVYLASQKEWSLQATAYYATYDDKIFRRIGELTLDDGSHVTGVNIYTNGNEFSSKGVETEIRFQSEQYNWGAFFNINYIRGDKGDLSGDDEYYNFKFSPKYSWSLGVNKRWQHFTLSSTLNYRDSTEGPDAPIDSALTIDVNAIYLQRLVGVELSHNIRINNLNKESASVAEYVRRRGVNEYPILIDRSISYQLSFTF